MNNVIDTVQMRNSALEHLWMHNRDWVQMAEDSEPLIIVGGEGIRVTDSDGQEWIDAHGGYASVNAGYGRSEIAEVMRDQMKQLAYFPQGSTTEPLVDLVEKIAELTPGDLERSWPVTGGSEANETAIKIARAYQKRRGEPGRYKIISRRGSYHGALGTVMWTGGNSLREDYEPAFPGMVYAPQPNSYRCEFGGETPSECAIRCAQAIEDLILFHGPSTVAAVLAEPIASNPIIPGGEYWPMLRQICDKYGVVLIADEVINGFGRTGKMFAMEHFDVVPDIMTMAKGITSSYLPLANTIVTPHIADSFAGKDNIFHQALTFGGHPVTAAVALANIEIIEKENLVENSEKVGEYMLAQLKSLQDDHEIIGDVRGIGLLVGIEFVKDKDTKTSFPIEANLSEKLTDAFREERIILMGGNGRTVSMGPPLCMTPSDVDDVVSRLDRAIGGIENSL